MAANVANGYGTREDHFYRLLDGGFESMLGCGKDVHGNSFHKQT